LKESGHCGFLPPSKLESAMTDLLSEAVQLGCDYQATDFKAMDATIGSLARKIEECTAKALVVPEQQDLLEDVLDCMRYGVKTAKGEKHKKVNFDIMRQTGARDTTYGNTHTAMLFLYTCYRAAGYSSEEAWSRKWLCAGDDTVFSGIPDEILLKVAKMLGLDLPPDKLVRKKCGTHIDFLSFEFKLWGSTVMVSRVCGRQLGNFQVTRDRGDISTNLCRSRRAAAYLSVFRRSSPLLTSLCKYFLRVQPSDDAEDFGYYWQMWYKRFVDDPESNQFNRLIPDVELDTEIAISDVENLGTTHSRYWELVAQIDDAQCDEDLPDSDWFYLGSNREPSVPTLVNGGRIIVPRQGPYVAN